MTWHATPARVDVLVALGCATVTTVALLLLPVLAQAEPEAAAGLPVVGDSVWWAVLATLVVQSAVLAWRRRRPLAVACVVVAAVPVGAALGIGPAIGLTSVALLVAFYTVATLRAPARVWPLLLVFAVVVGAGHTTAALRDEAPIREAVATGLVQTLFLVTAPLLVAALVVARRDSHSAREDRVQALEREHHALVQAAVARERTAMARELHDIAAHHLTGIAVMSSAIATQIDTDPSGAKAAVGEVRRQSTAVLRDLRSLVVLLRDHDETTAAAGVQVETLAGVPGLVSGRADGGQDVVLTVRRSAAEGPLGAGIGPLAQLTAYRMVQESLANAGRHATGARCEVVLDDRAPEDLVVTVVNAPAPRAPDPDDRGGLGLVGMRERAELTGSRLDVGPTPEGGWQVRLRIPRTGPVDVVDPV